MHAVPGISDNMTPFPAPVRQGAILLIDDDELIAVSLRDCLVRRGLTVDVSLDVHDAQTRMRARQYETIVVDPYLTGGVHEPDASLLDTIRNLQPDSAIVVLTGYGNPSLVDGATFLAKPQPIPYLSQLIAGGSAALNSPDPVEG
jgi:ActR/RegA family two-component response regulator